MRILVTGPDVADSFTHNVAHTLREMGREVLTDPAQSFGMRQSSARRALEELIGRAWPRFRLRSDARVRRLASAWRPQLTLMCTQTFEPETVRALRRTTGAPVVCWYGDAAANLKRDHVVSGEYDAVFAKDPDLVRTLRQMLGLEAHHLPEACNPSWHRPVAERAGNEVVVAGTSYGYRNALVGRLLAAGEQVRVYGAPPGGWVPAVVRAAHAHDFLDHKTKAATFGKALACFSSFAPAEGRGSVNCRVFETCACGGLLLSEAREALERFFEPGREYLSFSSFEECLDHLARLRRDYTEARAMRERAARRAHAEHSYRRRLEDLLRTLGLA